MTLERRTVTHGETALRALREAIDELQAGDRLADVTVVVASNSVGVAARRWLAAHGGIAAVQFLTVYRLAELLGGPALARSGRRPVTPPVVDVAARRALERQGGRWRDVAHHQATVDAVRTTYAELRQLDAEQWDLLRRHASGRGRDVVRVCQAVHDDLRRHWFDERDLLEHAALAVPPQRVVVHLPERLRPGHRRLLQATAAAGRVIVIEAHQEPSAHPVPPVEVIESTDADEEVREAVRQVLAAAQTGVAFASMAIVWPHRSPYARIVTDQLSAAGIPWNGQAGNELAERLAARIALGWLRLDQRGLRRTDLFALLAQVPARDRDRRHIPNQRFERVSRAAGVQGTGDWQAKLTRFAERERARHADSRLATDAQALLGFVQELVDELGPADAPRPPSVLATDVDRVVHRWLGNEQLATDEADALEQVERILLRLRSLDATLGPLTRADFADLLDSELAAAPTRVGRIGDGVQVGPLGFAVGQPLDLLVVLGAADGILPTPPPQHGLLPDHDRALVGDDLPRAADWPEEQRRQFTAALAGSRRAVLCVPRGDLRATASRTPSRLIAELAPRTQLSTVRRPSFAHTMRSSDVATDLTHFRVRSLSAARAAGQDLHHHPLVAAHAPLTLGLALLDGRAEPRFTHYDGFLPGFDVHLEVVSPTALERWSECPWQFFVQHVLGVRPIEDPAVDHTISPADQGTLVHDVLDDLHQMVLGGALPQPVDGWQPQHLRAAARAFDIRADAAEQAGKTGRAALWHHERRVQWRILQRFLAGADSEALRRRHAVVEASECPLPEDGSSDIQLTSGRTIRVRGTIDRIDRGPDGLIVVDFKSGRSDKMLDQDNPTTDGKNLQLLLYALAAPRLVGAPPDTPVQVEYAMVRSGKRPSIVVDQQVRDELDRQLQRIIGAIDQGVFIALPVTSYGYIRCPMCDPDGLGTVSAERRLAHKLADPRLVGAITAHTDGGEP